MNKTLLLANILCLTLAAANLSMSWPSRRMGLLTDDYGVITKQDLDEEEEKAIPQPFPSDFPAFQYWQCLPTNKIYIKCDALGFTEIEKGGEIGQHTLELTSKREVFHFYTRHNSSLQDCREMVAQWNSVIQGENIVCISGSYLGTDLRKNETGNLVKHSTWEIDRMKSGHGEWSWFDRDKR